VLLFSCEEEQATKVVTPSVTDKRLFVIQEIRRVIPYHSSMYYAWSYDPYFELTIKNVSGFDLHYHYKKTAPLWAGACMKYIKFPDTGGCMFLSDTSRVVKSNEEFVLHMGQFMPNSLFYQYEYQAINFQILISSSNDLSGYYKPSPTIPRYIQKLFVDHDGIKKYGYPLEFVYSTSTGFFCENYLLE
jgi:hypothetical protein